MTEFYFLGKLLFCLVFSYGRYLALSGDVNTTHGWLEEAENMFAFDMFMGSGAIPQAST